VPPCAAGKDSNVNTPRIGMRMHAWGRRAKKLSTLALAPLILCAIAYGVMPATTARAATMQETLADDVFQNEPGSTGRCTIYAATNMLRRAALLNGDADWTSITTSSIPSSGGLPWSFSIATPSASYVVGHGSISGTDEEKTAQLMGILEESPAGIVLYAGDCSSPHAVLLLGCKDGTFYAHDSLTGATSALDECVTVRVSNASSYWYVSSGVLSPDPVSIAGATVSVSSSGTGPKDAAGAAVSVTLGSASLVEGTDFTVSYESSVNVGMATVTVTGMGRYAGTVTSSFQVEPSSGLIREACSAAAENCSVDKTSSAMLTSAVTL